MARNKELILKLADYIETDSRHRIFDMRYWRQVGDCGTTACIGGHLEMLLKRRRYALGEETVAVELGLSDQQARNLCFDPKAGNGVGFSRDEITKPMAVAALRRLAKTGRVYFSKADDK